MNVKSDLENGLFSFFLIKNTLDNRFISHNDDTVCMSDSIDAEKVLVALVCSTAAKAVLVTSRGGKLVAAERNGELRANRASVGPWEFLISSATPI